MEIRKGRHVVYAMHAHIIFVTKYRGKILTDAILMDMESLFNAICETHEVELKQFNGESDHVHLLIEYKPTLMLSKLVNALKGTSSRELKRSHESLNKAAWRNNALWFCCCGRRLALRLLCGARLRYCCLLF